MARVTVSVSEWEASKAQQMNEWEASDVNKARKKLLGMMYKPGTQEARDVGCLCVIIPHWAHQSDYKDGSWVEHHGAPEPSEIVHQFCDLHGGGYP